MHEVLKAVNKIVGKGDPIVMTGMTCSGKSTVLGTLAKNDIVKALLWFREGLVQGRTTNVSATITDYAKIPEDKLIMIAELPLVTIADCNDDNLFLGQILYDAESNYKDERAGYRTLLNMLSSPIEGTLAYRIADIDTDRINEILMKFDRSSLAAIYSEVLVRVPRGKKERVSLFTELLSERKEFSEVIEEFWDLIVSFLNEEIKDLSIKLENNGAMVEMKPDGGYRFTAILGEEEFRNGFVKAILQNEHTANVSFVYRGEDYIFENDKSCVFTVVEESGLAIRCIRLIDTRGLFCDIGGIVEQEAERIIDLLSEYSSDKLIVTVNSHTYGVSQRGYDAICQAFERAPRKLDVYVLFTHWDSHLRRTISEAVRRGASLRTGLLNAIDEQQKVIDVFKGYAVFLDSLEFYRAAFSDDGIVGDMLDEMGILYPDTLSNLFKDLATKSDTKYRIYGKLDDLVYLPDTKQRSTTIFASLVTERNGERFSTSEIRDCIDSWLNAGDRHVAYRSVDGYVYRAYMTDFIQKIRNYASICMTGLQITTADYKLADGLVEYLARKNNVAHELARMIGREAYSEGFLSSKKFRSQYDRFSDMLQYTQDMCLTGRFKSILSDAIGVCIQRFIDSKCIVVENEVHTQLGKLPCTEDDFSKKDVVECHAFDLMV